MHQGICYYISDGSALDSVIGRILKGHDLEEAPAYVVTRTFLDSFDWRLYSGGVQIWMERGEGETVKAALYQKGIPKSSPARRFALTETVPATSDDLPRGPVRKEIAKLLEMRVLLPQVEIKSYIRRLNILDDRGKTVLRVYIEESASRDPSGEEYKDCGSRLILQPVKGYPEPQARVEKIADKMGLRQSKQGLLEEALSAIGKDLCSYSSKIGFSFAPDMHSDLAAREILLHLLDIIETNLPGVKANLDSEFLHDMRVAVRRMRSALSQIKGVFSPSDIKKFKSGLAWVGQATGPTRDMDVYLLEFDKYRACLPERFRDDLDPLHAFLENHRKTEHGVMVKKLNSPHFRTLMKELRTFLEDTEAQNNAPEAATPISDLANKRIQKMYRQVMKDGQAIDDNSPAEHLHELRKECKKLRYLMEFFRSLYPKKKIEQLIKSLKQLLDNLGNFQDMEVQAYTLRDYARQMVEEGDAPHDTLLAMGMLVDGLFTRQQQIRIEFADRFARFSQSANAKIFQELFAPKTNKGKG